MKFCDVSLPVPVDQLFTYSLPVTLQHRVQMGCRVFVPFGSRKLTGVVLALSDETPDGPVKEAAAAHRRTSGSRLRDDRAGTMDRGVLLLPARRCAALNDPAYGRASHFEDV